MNQWDRPDAQRFDEPDHARRRCREAERETEDVHTGKDRRRASTETAFDPSPECRKDAILASALDAIVMIDEEARTLEFNPAAEKIFGYRREEILGRSIIEYLVPPRLRKAHRHGMRRYLAGGDPRILGRRIEMTGLRADGSEVPVEIAVTEAQVRGRTFFTAYLRDLTERKRAEAAQHESERRFRTLFENSPDPIFVEDLEGNVLDVNPAACRLHHVRREDLVGLNVRELVPPDRRERAMKDFARLVEGRLQHVEGYSWTVEGRAVPVEIRVSRISYAGQPAVLLHVRDITERKDFEEQLRAREEHLRTILDSEPECVKRLAADGTLLDMNPAGLAMIEADCLEAVRGCSVYDLILPPYRAAHQNLVARVFRGEAGTLEFEIEGLRGTRRWMETHAVPLRDAQGQVTALLAVTRDVTMHKRSEQALIEAKEQAEEMSRLKSAFLNNMSHEIRTPLTAIIGFSGILAQEAAPHQKELVELIEQSGKRLLNTLNAVLDLSMLEAGSLRLDREWLSVAEAVREKVAGAQSLAREKGVHLDFTAAADVRAYLDRTCLDRIVHHLIDNAIKFTEEGRVNVCVCAEAERFKICVADTGVGICESFQPYLFEAFKQESTGITRSHVGAGLGLSITRRIVTLMGGEIAVRSRKHEGSHFEVSFPLAVEAQAASPAGPALNGRAAPHRPRVLVVEDNPEIELLLQHMLGDAYNVATTKNEQGALRLARQAPFDLVLLDINLGADRTGVDVLTALRALPGYAAVPVVAMTAYALLEDRERFLEAGFDGYLSKPFTTRELEAVIRHLLGALAKAPAR